MKSTRSMTQELAKIDEREKLLQAGNIKEYKNNIRRKLLLDGKIEEYKKLT